MKKCVAFSILLILLIFGCSPPDGSTGSDGNTSSENTNGTTIEINVLNLQEQGINGAAVVINGETKLTYKDEDCGDGYCVFENVKNGTYAITASMPGFTSNSITITLEGKDNYPYWCEIDLHKDLHTNINGTISYKDKLGNVQAVPNAIIEITDNGDKRSAKPNKAVLMTDSNGNYECLNFNNEGELKITNKKEGFYDWAETIKNVSTTLTYSPVISCKWIYETKISGNVIKSSDKSGLAGVQIFVGDFKTNTDADGHYELTVQHDGWVTIMAGMNGYVTCVETINNINDTPSITKNFEMQQPDEVEYRTIVSGIITNKSGLPCKDVEVTCNGNKMTTKEDGKYEIEVAHNGAFYISWVRNLPYIFADWNVTGYTSSGSVTHNIQFPID